VTSGVRDVPAGDLTVEQVRLIVQRLTAIHEQLGEVVEMMHRFAAAGGRDWQTWDRLLDHIGRAGTKLTQYSGDPAHPDWHPAAEKAIAEAASTTIKDGVLSEVTHRKLAEALLLTIWRSGGYFLVNPDDWPDLLPAVVLGAVHTAPLINADDLMDHLREPGNADPR
jgi:hypothetical protein